MTEGQSTRHYPILVAIIAPIKTWFDAPLTKSNLFPTMILSFLASFGMMAVVLYGLYALGLFS